jgi:transposase InsO family protein
MVSVLDDYSRRIPGWDLVRDIQTPSLADVIQQAVEVTGRVRAPLVLGAGAVERRPALLTDNGSGYISNLMGDFLRAQGLHHIRARGHHPQTIGKVERWHRTMKDEVTLVVHMSPDELRGAIGEFVHYYNRQRYHEVYLPLAWRWET